MKKYRYKIEIDMAALKKVKKKMDRSIERTGEPFPGANKFSKLFKAKKSLLAVAWIYFPYVRKS